MAFKLIVSQFELNLFGMSIRNDLKLGLLSALSLTKSLQENYVEIYDLTTRL